MAYPAQFAHIVLFGALPGGENWAAGWWHTESEQAGGWDESGWQDRVDQYRDALTTADVDPALATTIRGMNPNTFSLAGVRGYLYEGSLSAASFSAEADFASGSTAGTGSTAAMQALQCSLVASWRAGAGASQRGRTYLPALTAQPSSAGQVPSALCDQIAGGFGAFYRVLAVPAVQPIVVSRTKVASYAVKSVRVDSIQDIQRRRVDHLVPAHTASVPFPQT